MSFDGIDNAQVNFGKITVDDYGDSRQRDVTLGVLCSAMMSVKLSVVDNMSMDGGASSGPYFRLRANGGDVGSYVLVINNQVTGNNGLPVWLVSNGVVADNLKHSASYTLVDAEDAPMPIVSATIPLSVWLEIDSDAFNNLKEELPFEGSATVELYIL